MKASNIFKNKKVLITGHTGFKGAWLSFILNQLGAKVTGISDYNFTKPSLYKILKLNQRIDSRKIDICNSEKISNIINNTQPNFIFHLAAQSLVHYSYKNPLKTWQTNAIGTINVLDSLKKIKNKCVVIMITSDKCYENLEWSWGYRETDKLGGSDPYSASKGAAEFAIKSYVDSFYSKNDKIRLGIGRAGNVIGGGDWAENRIIPDCIRAWSTNKIVSLRNPNSTRPWQHVFEPLSGYMNLAAYLNKSKSIHGEPFNFGPKSENEFSVHELVKEMKKHWDKVKWKIDLNKNSYNEAGLLKLNCDKANHILNWKPTWGFERTISETMIWYKTFYNQPKSILDLSISQIQNFLDDAKMKID